MTCREFIEFLWKYASDELSSEEREQFDYHLTRCPRVYVIYKATKRPSKSARLR